MKWIKHLVLPACLILINVQCGKDKESTTVHCDALPNDPAEPGAPLLVQVPNAFTPNRDGKNDKFRVLHRDIQSVKLTIYGENNNVIYHSQFLSATWDPGGTITATTKYYYRVEAVAQGGRRIGLCGEVMALLCYSGDLGRSKYNFENEVDSLGGWTNQSGEQLNNCNP